MIRRTFVSMLGLLLVPLRPEAEGYDDTRNMLVVEICTSNKVLNLGVNRDTALNLKNQDRLSRVILSRMADYYYEQGVIFPHGIEIEEMDKALDHVIRKDTDQYKSSNGLWDVQIVNNADFDSNMIEWKIRFTPAKPTIEHIRELAEQARITREYNKLQFLNHYEGI